MRGATKSHELKSQIILLKVELSIPLARRHNQTRAKWLQIVAKASDGFDKQTRATYGSWRVRTFQRPRVRTRLQSDPTHRNVLDKANPL
jgi:hypothetical protein